MLFGIVEIFGFSGYVAAVVFGAVLVNIEVFHSFVWLGLARTVPVRDASLVAIMSPKGLAAVVLASMPLEQQIREGPMLQSVTYSVGFFEYRAHFRAQLFD